MHQSAPYEPPAPLLLFITAARSPTARAAVLAHPALGAVTVAADLADLRRRLVAAPATPVLLVHGTEAAETLTTIATLITTAPFAVVLLLVEAAAAELEIAALEHGVSECLDRAALDAGQLPQVVARARARATWRGARGARPPAEIAADTPGTRQFIDREAAYRKLADSVPVLLWMDDADHQLIYQNQTADDFTGRTVADNYGRNWFADVHPEDMAGLEACYARTSADPVPYQHALRLRRADGTYRRVLEIGVPRFLEGNQLGGFVGVDVDITELMETATRLQDAEERYQSLIAALQEGVTLHETERGLVYANAAAQRILGLTLDQLMGRSLIDPRWQILRPDGTVFPNEELPAAVTLRTGQPFEGVPMGVHRPDGSVRWLTVSTQPLRHAGMPAPYAVVVSFADVTAERTSLMALRTSEQRYRTFIEQSSEGIWRYEFTQPVSVALPELEQIHAWAMHSYLAECNTAMARMYGYEQPEAITGSRISDLFSLDDPANQAFLSAFIRAGYRLTEVESHEHDRHNQPRIFLNNLVGQVENGALVRIWGTQRDITVQKQLEEETRQARRMETAGRLAGGIAHDFNNLLTVILGTSDILLQDPTTQITAREDVDEIKRAATRAASLTRQLLAFSRRQVLQPRIIDLDALVDGVERMLQRLIGEDVALVTQHHPGLWRIQADPGQLEQVLLNLCVNARDAMPTGGRLTISTGNVNFAGVESGPESVMPRGEYVGMTVEDGGSGMSAEVLQHIFEPFYTTKEPGKGTGLGLATVYGIVKQSDGFIFADSTPNAGSRFRIFFPRVEGTPEAVEPPIVTPASPSAAGTILLVEDEKSVRRLARRVLENAGYRVLEATDGHEALTIAAQWLGAVDLVVTDIVMPGMSGQELSLRLRERDPALRILYVSGYTDDAILQHGTLLPDTAFLHKPFSPALLVSKVGEVLLR